MAGTTIRGVENSGNVQMPDMATAAKQNAGTGFQAVWNKTQSSAQTANASTNNRNRTDHSDVRRGDSLKNGDRQRDNLVHASDDKGMDTEKTDGSVGNHCTESDRTDHRDFFHQRRRIAGNYG